MSRRVSTILQVDVARAIRAAKQNGADAIQVTPDGTITILLKAPTIAPADEFEAWEREHAQAKAARRRDR